jgi:CBS domain-containing protein
VNVKSIMKTNPATVTSTDLLSTASQIMLWAGGRHLPVVDVGRIVGVLSGRDILRVEAQREQEIHVVRGAMSAPAHTIMECDSIATAAGRMARERVGCLPVVDGLGQLVGIVTTTDVLGAMAHNVFATRAESMSDDLKEELSRLRTIRDHVRVRAHLGGMELHDIWGRLEDDFAQAERHAANTGDAALEVVRKFRERAEHSYDQLIRGLMHELESSQRTCEKHIEKLGRTTA